MKCQPRALATPTSQTLSSVFYAVLVIDFINIFLCNYSGLLSKCHIVTRYSMIWWKGGGG